MVGAYKALVVRDLRAGDITTLPSAARPASKYPGTKCQRRGCYFDW